jgi:hypothetical protein
MPHLAQSAGSLRGSHPSGVGSEGDMPTSLKRLGRIKWDVTGDSTIDDIVCWIVYGEFKIAFAML